MNMPMKLNAEPLTSVKPAGAPEDPSGLGCLVILGRHHGLHLTVAQLVHDNVLPNREVTVPEIIKCATAAGLKGKSVHLDWNELAHLKKALPVIVRLKTGGSMVLLRLADDEAGGKAVPGVVLQDPNAAEDALLIIDRVRFEEVWTGEVLMIKRDYDIADEEQPFKLGLIVALIFRERRIVRDTAICAVILGFLALSPIIFFMVLQNKVIYYHAFNTFYVVCLAMGVLIAFETAFAFLRQFLVVNLTTRVDIKLSTYIFEKVLSLPIDYFERTQVGLVAHDMREVTKIRQFLTGQLFGTLLDSTTLLFFLPVMFFFSPTLTAVVLAFCGMIVLWIIAMLPAYRRKTGAVIAAESAQGAFLVQTLYGIRTVKSLALDARQRNVWDVHVARVAKLRLAEGMTAGLIQSVVRPLERLAVSGSYALGVYFALTTNDPALMGALFAFLMLSQRVAGPLMQMATLIHQYDEARAAVGIVGNLVNQPPEEGRSGHGVRAPLKGEVEFSHVRFKYKGATSPALNDVSFEVPQGTTLGIMGRSGSGKTTITRLMQRLHSDYEGLIKIDGVDVREYDVDHLRSSLGVVLQENFLFSGTIRENITIAKSDATFDEVVRAARLAGAEEFIDKLPRGYETYVYEGSPNLSGGQRQRLAIARALITDPAVLILDEATSALDAESEAIVTANIARIGHGRTMIIISHRLSSLVTADAILALDAGEVLDIGKHEELLARCDIYSDLWYQQNRHITGAARPDKTPFKGPSLVS
jgi:ATP-binding cassette subfamily B protein